MTCSDPLCPDSCGVSQGWRFESVDKIARVYAQGSRQLQNVVQRQVAPAALDLADEGPVQASGRAEGFLAEAKLLAAGAYALTEDGRRSGQRLGWSRHSAYSPYVP